MVLALTGYNQTTVFQDDLARFGIKLNIGLIPAIFISIGILVLIKFPIDASTEEYKDWKRRVEELHERKVKEYKKSLEN
ncbi:MAG: hypothetical protein GF311_27270 [Candidatus Lokiarchaeota archaeon]|nr:hypothetical protein [Candidatus Lokiarchaeota archaeon]